MQHDPRCAGRGVWFTEEGERTVVTVCKACAWEKKWREHVVIAACLILGVTVMVGLAVSNV